MSLNIKIIHCKKLYVGNPKLFWTASVHRFFSLLMSFSNPLQKKIKPQKRKNNGTTEDNTPSNGDVPKKDKAPNKANKQEKVAPKPNQMTKKDKVTQPSKPNQETTANNKLSKKEKAAAKKANVKNGKTQKPTDTTKEKSLAIPMKAKDKKNAKNQVSGSLTDKLKDSLKGSRFRFLNECLYKSKSSEAVQMFKEDPEAFSVYHEGYRQQVTHWPTNPLDRIIKAVRKM